MREAEQTKHAYQPYRSCNNDRHLLGCLPHYRSEDEHSYKLCYHQHCQYWQIVVYFVIVSIESMLYIVDGHAGDEVHASLPEEVKSEEEKE